MTVFANKRLFPHRLRREVSAFAGILTVLLQLALPFASAFSASPSTLQEAGQPQEVICTVGGRIIGLSANTTDSEERAVACEFCLVCQIASFGHAGAPKTSEAFNGPDAARYFWNGPSAHAAMDSTDFAVRPIRAPPALVQDTFQI